MYRLHDARQEDGRQAYTPECYKGAGDRQRSSDIATKEVFS
jgi:hypothetical protein